MKGSHGDITTCSWEQASGAGILPVPIRVVPDSSWMYTKQPVSGVLLVVHKP